MATFKSDKKGSSADNLSSAEEQSSLNQTIGREARAAAMRYGATGEFQSTVAELGADVQLAAFKRAGCLQKRAADSINGFADSVESAGKISRTSNPQGRLGCCRRGRWPFEIWPDRYPRSRWPM